MPRSSDGGLHDVPQFSDGHYVDNTTWGSSLKQDRTSFREFRDDFMQSSERPEPERTLDLRSDLIGHLRPFGLNGTPKRRYRERCELKLVNISGENRLRFTDYRTGRRFDEVIDQSERQPLEHAARSLDRKLAKERAKTFSDRLFNR